MGVSGDGDINTVRRTYSQSTGVKMNSTLVSGLDTTILKTQEWLGELGKFGDSADPEDAYTALRAVLQTLRDVLTVDEAAQLGAVLPLLIRGLYYDGWDPSQVPCRVRNREQFLNRVWARMRNDGLDPEDACRAVFTLLQRRVDGVEIEAARQAMHGSLQGLWNMDFARAW